MAVSSPYISFVVASRNDDHGGNLLFRMQLFTDALIAQCNRHCLDAELIVVEWNPAPERPRLFEALRWPENTGRCAVRFIEVPETVHRRFENSDKLPLFQMIAKNAGVRRAHGSFVLATNIDILFSDELMQTLASGQLRTDRMYRVDRYDVTADLPAGLTVPEQLAWCRKHVTRMYRNGGTFEIKGGKTVPVHPANQSLKGRLKRLFAWLAPSLHTNACGDFTLLSRDKWQAVRGYPEMEIFSYYLDGLLCHAAHFAGARETCLKDPMRIYHIEHDPGSGWTPGIGGLMMEERLEKAGITRLDYSQYLTWVNQMKKEKAPIFFNKDDRWGLVDMPLVERIVAPR
ncbi:MAG: hypothetical protein AB1724_06320 [Thermodesulfobacteriota bacterium]